MDSSKNDKSGSDAILMPVPEALASVGCELRLIADSVDELQNLIGSLVDAKALAATSALYQLQCLDRLAQNLGAMSDYLSGIAQASSAAWKIDVAAATRSLKLEDVKERLTGCERQAEGPSAGAGDFEEFALTG